MPVPKPVPIYRIIHVDNLNTCLRRGGLHTPNNVPNDELSWKAIHDDEIQQIRAKTPIPCRPGGMLHDYVPFYFGFLSPMMYRLKEGGVEGYNEGQEPLIYLCSTVADVANSKTGFIFSDGHGIARFTKWYNDIRKLDKVDWDMVYQLYWADKLDENDRKRRKQAEFLVHRFCSWSLIKIIGVRNSLVKKQVEDIMGRFPSDLHRVVRIRRNWYY